MATLTSSVSADVPAGFADTEWTEFVRRSLFDSAATDSAELAVIADHHDLRPGVLRGGQQAE